jgi:hypothetical protein
MTHLAFPEINLPSELPALPEVAHHSCSLGAVADLAILSSIKGHTKAMDALARASSAAFDEIIKASKPQN